MIERYANVGPAEKLTTPQRHSTGPREFMVPVLACAVAALGLLNIWSALLAAGPHRAAMLHRIVHMPDVIEHGSRTLIALFGLILLMLARSLARHKKQAWRLTVLLIAPSPFLHVAKGLDWEEAMISIALLATLLVYRRSFYAGNDRPSARNGIIAASAMVALVGIYGPLGFYLLRRQFWPEFTLRRALLECSHIVVGSPMQDVLITSMRRALWFEDSLQYVTIFAIVYCLGMLLKPVFPSDVTQEQERHEARRLLKLWGGPPLAYFGLLPDKRYHFGPAATTVRGLPDRGAPGPRPSEWAIPYRVVGRCAVALGDPLGDPGRVREAVSSFLSLCRQYDWLPAFYQVTARHLDVFRDSGLKVLKVGEDAVVDLTSFSLKGKAFQDLRTAINKMLRVGIVFEECPTRLPPDDGTMTQLAEITEDWLSVHHGEEKGFAMGQFAPGTESFEDSRLFIARDRENDTVLAFVTFVPIHGGEGAPTPTGHATGWGLDLMRRRTSAPNGVMDFLIASAAVQFQAEGAEVMSLGLSPLAGPEDEECLEDSEWLERLRALLFERFNQFYHFKGLNAFKAKFSPGWEPRYLVFPAASQLPTIAYAVVRAHASRRFRYLLGLGGRRTAKIHTQVDATT